MKGAFNMTNCLQTLTADICFLYIVCPCFFFILPLMIKTIQENHFSKEWTFVLAIGLFEFCFLALLYIVARNTELRNIPDYKTIALYAAPFDMRSLLVHHNYIGINSKNATNPQKKYYQVTK